MGRLFWKFFLSILLAQVAATIGGTLWLRDQARQRSSEPTLDVGMPAQIMLDAAGATLKHAGIDGLRELAAGTRRVRLFVLDEQGHELLGRTVPSKLREEVERNLENDGGMRAVARLKGPDGRSYLAFALRVPGARGSLLSPQSMGMGEMPGPGGPGAPGGQGDAGTGGGPGGRDGAGNGMAPGGMPGRDGPRNGNADGMRAGGGMAGDQPGMPGAFGGPGAPGGPGGPGGFGGPGGPGMGPDHGPAGWFGLPPDFGRHVYRWLPLVAATLASLLFAALLAWYFSRPIRALQNAFEAAAAGDLAPKFAHAKRGLKSGLIGDELAELGHDFDRMSAQLRSLMEAQRRLLHDVSHELRSPLARLQAAIGLAHQQPDKLMPSLERIEREGTRMDRLVGELLTLSRLEAATQQAGDEPVDLVEMVDQIADDARFEAGAHIDVAAPTPLTVRGAPDLLWSAIENIVRNAVKHGGADNQVDVVLRPDGADAHVDVLDRGPGIAEAHLGDIFEPFFRSNPTRNNVDGHGLGLAIAKRVVENHGGRITAANRPGGGLRVTISLPRVA